MLEHLSNPEYLHVLLNPLPVYGLAIGVLGLIIALIAKSRAARITSLALVFIAAFSAWPVYAYGEKAYDRVLAMADPDGVRWLEEHMRRAETLIYIFYAVALLAVAGLIAELRFRRAAVPIAVLTVALATTAVAVGGHIAQAGGRIRHREFRYEPPPPQRQHEDDHQ